MRDLFTTLISVLSVVALVLIVYILYTMSGLSGSSVGAPSLARTGAPRSAARSNLGIPTRKLKKDARHPNIRSFGEYDQ